MVVYVSGIAGLSAIEEQLKKIADELARANKLKEKELGLDYYGDELFSKDLPF